MPETSPEPFFVTQYTEPQLQDYLGKMEGSLKSPEDFEREVTKTLYDLTLALRDKVKGCALVVDRSVAFAGFSAEAVFDEVLTDKLTDVELKLMEQGWNINTGHLPGHPNAQELLRFSEFAINDLLEQN